MKAVKKGCDDVDERRSDVNKSHLIDGEMILPQQRTRINSTHDSLSVGDVDGQLRPLSVRVCRRENGKVQSAIQYQAGNSSCDYCIDCSLWSILLLHTRIFRLLLVIYPDCRHSERCSSTVQAILFLVRVLTIQPGRSTLGKC